ncbi:MAG: hypothetical protein A3F90_14795 [Deltaproteobacteria bacterium RIFCSPLOWO2_12_FULL_60_19]|nr:MAG: hypothetical protein A3F90_14795 [Deltaproteobacteria bacterium RIFCSPLOWO2_12_FULL_60_19]
MAFQDLRAWISLLDGEGEIQRIKAKVDWNLELGAVFRKVLNAHGPALLFENIKDHETTWCRKFFCNGLGSRKRVNLALGLAPDTGYREIVQYIKRCLAKPIPSAIIPTGPVKENIVRGKEVDLFQFPVPKWHHLDGGRYINTAASIVTRDPETAQLNAGTYRGMIGKKDTIPSLIVPGQHGGIHLSKYKARGEPAPVAVVYGWDPALFMVASTPVRHKGCSEYEIAGSLRGKPVELVKCETSDLLVPATAEIVVEGKISPNPEEYEMEGPFGEYTGYYGGMKSPKPTIKVECITFRNDPIFRGTLEGTSPGRWAEDVYFVCASFSAVCWQLLDDIGVPNVTGVWIPPVTNSTNMRVQIKKIYRGHAKQVANALWGTNFYFAKNVIVVDEDIDIYDDEAVEWALAYRTNAAMGDFAFFPGTIGANLDPSLPLADRDVYKYGAAKWTRVLMDATINWELEPEPQFGGKRYPPLSTDVDPEVAGLVEKRWKEYGF